MKDLNMNLKIEEEFKFDHHIEQIILGTVK